MDVVGGVLAAATSVGIVLVVLVGTTPRGRLSISGERDTVWLAAAVLAGAGTAFVLDRPWVGGAVAVLGAVGVARFAQRRFDRGALIAAVGGGALVGLCLVRWWWAGAGIALAVALALWWLTTRSPWRESVAPVVPGRIVRVGPARRGPAIGVLMAVVVGLIAAVPSPVAGLLVCALAAAVLVAYAVAVDLDRRPRLIVLAAAVVLLGGAILVAVDRDGGVVEIVLAAVVLVVSYVFGLELFTEVAGPFDELSDDLAHPYAGTVVRWAWVGAATPTTATVCARLRDDLDDDAVAITPRGDCTVERRGAGNDLARITLTGLEPGTRCRLHLPPSGVAGTTRPAEVRFTTFPADPTTVRIAAGSCASTGSQAAVFDRIARADPAPDVVLHLGDLHYENIGADDPAAFHAAYDDVLAAAPQARLFSSFPIAHVWDDHDFGPNNSDSSSPSRGAAQMAYREVEPHYPLPAGADDRGPGAIYQRFDVGPVRVLLTDTRSERSPSGLTTQRAQRTIMSPTQQAWIVEQVTVARGDDDCQLVVWGCSTPWIGHGDDQDIWEGFDHQRQRLFEQLAAIGMPLVFVAGDAHMTGIDDGTHSAPGGEARGFPVLAAAALDRRPSRKGTGEYTVGPHPGFGNFGTITVDTEPALTVTLAVHDRHGDVRSLVVDPAGWCSGTG